MVWSDQASQRRIQGATLGLARVRFQGVGACRDAQPPQEVALADRAEGRPSGGLGKSSEIDMGAEIGLARTVEDTLMLDAVLRGPDLRDWRSSTAPAPSWPSSC